ncbi:MAG: transcriptional repressor [Anaerolineaceae bacterium]|nr:transcriptional repressor [Anaerolineaceae bacterium]
MDWQDKLTTAGYRHSRPRGVVMGIMEKTKTPLSPIEILKYAQREGNRLGIASIYRALDLFLELGIVKPVHTDDDCHGYVLATEGHHHYITCSECNRVVEFNGSGDLSAIMSKVERETGFEVKDHLLQLYGLCRECRLMNRG